jgi:hypothetical protein
MYAPSSCISSRTESADTLRRRSTDCLPVHVGNVMLVVGPALQVHAHTWQYSLTPLL